MSASAQRLALLLRQTGANVEKVALDVGLAAGHALSVAGFDIIDGVHVDPDAVEAAQSGPWRAVWRTPDDGLGHVRAGDYATIVACGILSPDDEPDHVLAVLLSALAPGGRLGLAIADPGGDESDPVARAILAALASDDIELIEEQKIVDETGPGLLLVLTRA